jgi:hypothetical protein
MDARPGLCICRGSGFQASVQAPFIFVIPTEGFSPTEGSAVRAAAAATPLATHSLQARVQAAISC